MFYISSFPRMPETPTSHYILHGVFYLSLIVQSYAKTVMLLNRPTAITVCSLLLPHNLVFFFYYYFLFMVF